MSIATESAVLNQQAANEIVAALKAGRAPSQVRDDLISHGKVDPQSASAWVRDCGNAYANALSKVNKRHLTYGALWFFGGAAVTYYTFANASRGGTYFITWGAIIFGAFDIVRGLIGMQKASGLQRSLTAL